jgi:uncharacterized membrane protein YkoI
MKKAHLAVFSLVTVLGVSPVFASQTQTTKTEVKTETKTTEKTEHKHMKSDQAALQKEAKITMDAARATALKKAPGKVESSELEKEHGKLIYSFDIRNAKGTIDEVNVDAITGAVVAVEHESKAKEAAEKKQEAKEKSTYTNTTKH